ncbi:MAG TPA: hypothetical protein P5125_02720 [Kiritimatiellia bacterium]|nr:hypothetical protein [Kiritimatiellia bacterium]
MLILLRMILLFLGPVFLFVALLPTLLSTDAGRRFVLDRLNAAGDIRLTVEKWSWGWFRAPVLEQVSLIDPERGMTVTAERLTSDRGLWRLLPLGTWNAGNLTLEKPEVTLDLMPRPRADAAKPREPSRSRDGGFFLPILDIAAHAVIREGSLRVNGQSETPFEAQQIEGQITLTSFRKPIEINGQMRIGGGTLGIGGRVQSLRALTAARGAPLAEAEALTVKLLGVDLTAVRPLLREWAGQEWVSGGKAEGAFTVTMTNLDHLTLKGGVLVTRLTVAAAGHRPSPPGDLALMTDLTYERPSLTITRFDLSAPWVRAEASGALQTAGQGKTVPIGTLRAKIAVDLAAVARDFGPALNLAKGLRVRQGVLQGTVAVQGDETALGLDAALAIADLNLTVDGQPLILKPEPSLHLKASFPYGHGPTVETLRLKAPFAELYGSGRFDSAVVKGQVNLTRFSRDFKRILHSVPPMVGSISLDLATRREKGHAAVTGFLKVSDTSVEVRPGQRLTVPLGTLKLNSRVPMKGDQPERELQDTTFDVILDKTKLAGGWKRWRPAQSGQPTVLRGFTLAADTDLHSLRKTLGGLLPPPTLRRLASWQGALVANATAEAASGVVKARMNAALRQGAARTAAGIWRVPDLRMEGTLSQSVQQPGLRCETTATGSAAFERDGETVYAEPAARLVTDFTLAADGQSVRIDTFDIRSSLIEARARGSLSDLAVRRLLQAQGDMTVDFAAVTRLLDARGIDEFTLTGKAARPFRFSAPTAGGLTTLLAEGEFSGAAFLASAKGLGLDAGPSDVNLRLAKGVLDTRYAPTLNGGRMVFVPQLRYTPDGVSLTVPEKSRLLENVKITQQMVDNLLVNLNPMFHGSKIRDGTVTLDVRHFTYRPGTDLKTGLSADLSLRFDRLSLSLGPALREVLTFLKVKEQTYTVEHLPVHLVIRDGKTHVDPIRMVVGNQPIVFSGWVAFDGSIRYLLQVPITERLTGGAGKMLKGTTISIPITGTVTKPRVDLNVLHNALGGLIKQTVGEENLQKVQSFLEQLREEFRK